MVLACLSAHTIQFDNDCGEQARNTPDITVDAKTAEILKHIV
jgi:hypothetical protein